MVLSFMPFTFSTMEKDTIIWDWNGTLLNDVQMCVQCMNILLEKRKLPRLTVKKYRDVFGFPVKEYYEKIGFDYSREDFEIPAKEFMELYHQFLPETSLFPCAEELLRSFQSKGYRQLILSAMEHNSLVKTLKERNILSYFDAVSGIDNIFAGGKIEMARNFLKRLGLETEKMIFIGDTLHDREVAQALRMDYWLVAAGHQSEKVLKAKTARVVKRLSEVRNAIFV
jgi:phosphoglycolate phosphatase